LRDYDLFDAMTGVRIGTARVVDEITPGGLVLACKADMVRIELAAAPTPPAAIELAAAPAPPAATPTQAPLPAATRRRRSS